MTKRYTTKQVGFHWVLADAETGRETMMDSKTQAQRLAKQLNEREPTYRSRLRNEAGDEAAEMADAFLDANPDVAF